MAERTRRRQVEVDGTLPSPAAAAAPERTLELVPARAALPSPPGAGP